MIKIEIVFSIVAILLFSCQKDENQNNETLENGTISDTRDNQVYKVIEINNTWWMAENLNFNTENSVYYNGDSLNYHEYGKLYSYVEVLNACPDGWHLATDEEWKNLERAMGMNEDEIYSADWPRGEGIAQKLKVGGESKFEAKLGGCAFEDVFADLGLGYWWTATKKDDELIWFRSMSASSDGIERNAYPDTYKFSVRCVKDE